VLEAAIDAAKSCRLIDGNPGLLLGEKLGEYSISPGIVAADAK